MGFTRAGKLCLQVFWLDKYFIPSDPDKKVLPFLPVGRNPVKILRHAEVGGQQSPCLAPPSLNVHGVVVVQPSPSSGPRVTCASVCKGLQPLPLLPPHGLGSHALPAKTDVLHVGGGFFLALRGFWENAQLFITCLRFFLLLLRGD